MTPEHPTPRSRRPAALRLLAAVGLAAALSSCHDARRDNAFDPVRTPAVELTAALDDSTATATLIWTRYAGSAPFGHYLVLRSVEILGGQQVDTLTTIDDASQTAFVDSLLIHGTSYTYRVSAVNSDGFEVPSAAVEVGPVGLPAVRITGLEFDSGSATATLRWTPYAGRGFAAYHIRRSTPELAPADVVVLADPADTAYVGSNLLGATDYTYRVVVRTDRGEDVASQGETGGIHRLLAEWPLPVEPWEYVRLYARGPSGVWALAKGSGRGSGRQGWGRTLLYGADGELLEETVLPRFVRYDYGSRATAMAVHGAEGQTLCVITHSSAMLVPLPVQVETWDPFSVSLERSTSVPGQASLLSSSADREEATAFESVSLWVEDVQVLSEGFEAFPDNQSYLGNVNGWEFTTLGTPFPTTQFGTLYLRNGAATRADASWASDRIRLQAEVRLGPETMAGVQLGGDTQSRFALWLREGRAVLEWECPSCDGDDRGPASLTESLPIIPDVAYLLTLEVDDGNIRASVSSAAQWRGAIEARGDWTWTSATPVEEAVAFTVDELPFSVSPDGEFTAQTAFESYVSELRTWADPGGRGTRMGACFPELGKISTGLVPPGRALDWRGRLTRTLGRRVAADAGSLDFPVSFDAGPDGRIYVLDAGNSRVVAFDADGQFITQWGRRGSGPGQFDFGSGNVIPKGLDFAGSVAVDGEGRIYVAEVANQRIQVFAP